MKTITDYLDSQIKVKTVDKTVVQGRVPAKLVNRAKKILAKKDVGWGQFLTASVTQFVEENAKKK